MSIELNPKNQYMGKTKKLEVIGVVLTFIWFLSFLSQKFFFIDILKNAYGFGDFLMALGLILVAIGYRKKVKSEKEKTK